MAKIGTRANDILSRNDGDDMKAEDKLLTGTDQNDVLVGGKTFDSISGLGGDDAIFGKKGRDYLLGGDGDDIISGGRGKDTLGGNAGNDVLYGGRGSDTIFSGSGGQDEMTGGRGKDTFVLSVDNFTTIWDFKSKADQIVLAFTDRDYSKLGYENGNIIYDGVVVGHIAGAPELDYSAGHLDILLN